MTENERYFYNVAELAGMCGLSRQQIYNHIAIGDITVQLSGRKKLIPVAEAKRFRDSLPYEDRGALLS